MTQSTTPLTVAVAVEHAQIICPCCGADQPADFTLIEPEIRCYQVEGVTALGELALNPDSEPADFPASAQMPSYWLFCRCGTDFPLPAGTRLNLAGRPADPHYTITPHRFSPAQSALAIPGARRGTPRSQPEAA